MEIRGLGILRVPVLEATVVRLVVDLVNYENVPRLPDRRMTDLIGMDVPAVTLDPFEASAVTKVRLALELTLGRIMRHDDCAIPKCQRRHSGGPRDRRFRRRQIDRAEMPRRSPI